MTIVINAMYINGHFQPVEPLSLAEGTEVRLAVTPVMSEPGPTEEAQDSLSVVVGICSSRPKENLDNPPDEEPPNADDPLESVIGICKDGPPISLAADHDLYLYGPLRKE